MRKHTCETCRFWNQGTDEDDPNYGDCRRHPPTINTRLATLYSLQELDFFKNEPETEFDTPHWLAIRGVFPLTLSDDWCGEYQPTKGAEK